MMSEEMGLMNRSDLQLPPGFKFHPTDEEIITNYLVEKVMAPCFTSRAIGEVDLNKCEPWDLPSKAKMGDKEWYFFCHKDRKYPTGMRTNRATEAGYWKATGKDKEIYRGKDILVGMKKTLVFYKGRAPTGEKTNWVMHEFRLQGTHYQQVNAITNKDEWVVCKIFHKTTGMKEGQLVGFARMSSCSDDSNNSDSLMDHNSYLNSSSIKYNSLEDTQSYEMNLLPNLYSNAEQQYQNNAAMPSSTQINAQNPNYLLQQGLPNFGYLHQEQAMVNALVGYHNGAANEFNHDNNRPWQSPNFTASRHENNELVDSDHQRMKGTLDAIKNDTVGNQQFYCDFDVGSSSGPFFRF